ncbi:MAG: response regulator [Chloroflexota bacterium]
MTNRIARSIGWIDAGLAACLILAVWDVQLVLAFHAVFLLLTLGGLRWSLRESLVRVGVCAPIAAVAVGWAVARGTTQPQELAEIPVLLSTVVLVLVATRKRERAYRDLEATYARLGDSAREAKTLSDLAADADRVRNTFLSHVSQEIRTPLTSIVGALELLNESTLSARQRELLDSVGQGAGVLLTMVGNVVEAADPEAPISETAEGPCDIGAVLEDVADAVAVRAHAGDVEVLVDLDPEMPSSLILDGGRLRQVLECIADNSVRFTSQGEIVLRTRLLRSRAGEVDVEIEIRDTGSGMSPEQLELVFRPFSQIARGPFSLLSGMGLGIPRSHQIVKRMGGELSIQSAVDLGTSVVMRFSVRVAPLGAPPVPGGALRGLRLLVVDDNPALCRVLEQHARVWGVQARCAPTAEAALDALRGAAQRGTRFDVLVAEAMTVGDSGEELMAVVQSDPSLSSTALVRLTLQRAAAATAASIPANVLALQKPVRALHLYDTLVRATGRSGTYGPRGDVVARSDGAAHTDRLRLLLVEDNLVNQKVTLRLLARLGFEAEAVNDGKAAVEVTGVRAFDLVLMDCQMPVMDGFEATELIREREATEGRSRVPIIAMTAAAMSGDRERCLAAGMDDYVSKPASLAQLRDTVARWTAGRAVKRLPQSA